MQGTKSGDILKMIGTSGGPRSFTEEIFRSYMKKEITEEAYYEQNSIWVAENCASYRPNFMPTLAPVIKAYVGSRLSGARERDPLLARNLGNYLYEVTMCVDNNQADVKLFEWARDRCLAIGLEDLSKKLTKRIEEYQTHNLTEEVLMAFRARELDAKERDRRS